MRCWQSICVLTALLPLLGVPSVRAESWLPLEEYVDQCVLIVLCETEARDGKFTYRVLETWKGVYDPRLFHNTPSEDYLLADTSHGNSRPLDGQQVVFFYTARNHPAWTNGKLLSHSTCFPIAGEMLTYASTGYAGVRKDYTLPDFKAAVLARVRDAFVSDTAATIREQE